MLVSVAPMPLIRRSRSSTWPELGEIGRANLGQQVPAPVGVVHRRHARLAQQRGDHLAHLVALHRDAGPGLDLVGFGVGLQAHGVAGDHAVVFEAGDAVLDGAARDAELVRQRCHRACGRWCAACRSAADPGHPSSKVSFHHATLSRNRAICCIVDAFRCREGPEQWLEPIRASPMTLLLTPRDVAHIVRAAGHRWRPAADRPQPSKPTSAAGASSTRALARRATRATA